MKSWKCLAQCLAHGMHSSVLITHYAASSAYPQTHTNVSPTIQTFSVLPEQVMTFYTTLPFHVLSVLLGMLPTTCPLLHRASAQMSLLLDTFLMPLEIINQFPLHAPHLSSTLFKSLLLDLVKHLFSGLLPYELYWDRGCLLTSFWK